MAFYLVWNLLESRIYTQQTQNICITFVQRRPTTSTLVQHCTNVIQMFCVCWVWSQQLNIPHWINKKSLLNTVNQDYKHFFRMQLNYCQWEWTFFNFGLKLNKNVIFTDLKLWILNTQFHVGENLYWYNLVCENIINKRFVHWSYWSK